MNKIKCQKCNRKAKYTYSSKAPSSKSPEDQVYFCGYHTWWSGCHIDKEYRKSLNEEHKIK